MAPERILRKIAALDAKTVAAGCTPAEAAAAARLADSLRTVYSAHEEAPEPGLVRRAAAHGVRRPWTHTEDVLLRAWAAQGGFGLPLVDRTRGAIRHRLRKLSILKGSR